VTARRPKFARRPIQYIVEKREKTRLSEKIDDLERASLL